MSILDDKYSDGIHDATLVILRALDDCADSACSCEANKKCATCLLVSRVKEKLYSISDIEITQIIQEVRKTICSQEDKAYE